MTSAHHNCLNGIASGSDLDCAVCNIRKEYGKKPLRAGLNCHTAVFDDINKPAHYNYSAIEPINVIEAWKLDFTLGNVIKYIERHEHKGTPLKDLQKAKWYLERKIKQLIEVND
jgi:hypothetical protein